MNRVICNSTSGDKNVIIDVYTYQEFIEKYWKGDHGETVIRSTDGSEQRVKHRNIICDYCNTQIDVLVSEVCGTCRGNPIIKTACLKCRGAGKIITDIKSNVKIYVNGNYGICEDCFNKHYRQI